jgi:hypothetical protein
MHPAVRLLAAVLAGVFVWGFLWSLGNAAVLMLWAGAFDPDGGLRAPLPLLLLVLWSVALSLVVGWLAARIDVPAPRRAVWALAIVQFSIGVVVEAGSWALLPLWYHLVFLGLVIPATVLGGWLRWRRHLGEP